MLGSTSNETLQMIHYVHINNASQRASDKISFQQHAVTIPMMK